MMSIRVLGGFAAVCALSALGCSGSDSGSGSSSAVPSQCDHVGETACQANANCAVETGSISAAQQSEFTTNCITGFKGALDCSRQTKLTGHPDVCESDLSSTPCSSYV